MPPFLIPLLLGAAPIVAEWFGSGTKDAVTKVTAVAKEVLGVDSLDQVERVIAADPQKALEFKMALIAAATEEKRLAYQAEKDARDAYVAQLQATLQDIQSARAVAMSNSPARYGAILVSVLSITLAAAVAYMVMFPSPGASKLTESVVLMWVGAAISWVGQVQNFWLGSSMGSQQKDAALADIKKLLVTTKSP